MTVSRLISSVLNFHVSNKLERSNHGHCYKTMFQDPYRMQLKRQLKANCSEISLCVTHSCSGNVATEKAWCRILFAKCKSMHQKQLEQIRAFCTKAVKRCGCYSSLEVTENPGFEVKKYRWDTAQCAACNTGIHITHPLLCSCTYLQQGCPLSATCVRDRVSEQTNYCHLQSRMRSSSGFCRRLQDGGENHWWAQPERMAAQKFQLIEQQFWLIVKQRIPFSGFLISQGEMIDPWRIAVISNCIVPQIKVSWDHPLSLSHISENISKAVQESHDHWHFLRRKKQ